MYPPSNLEGGRQLQTSLLYLTASPCLSANLQDSDTYVDHLPTRISGTGQVQQHIRTVPRPYFGPTSCLDSPFSKIHLRSSMSKTVHVTSTSHFNSVLSTSKIVVVDFYADWCGPCKQVAPLYEQFSLQLSRSNVITFAKVNTDEQQEVARAHNITA
jgi:thiol-disulfide isomerase/thioredoxin